MKGKFSSLVFILTLSAMIVSGCGTAATPEPAVGMANPASVYCEGQGHTLELRTDADGGQYGVCMFADGGECEEWAFYRGECEPAASDAEQPVEVPTVAPTEVPTDPPTAQPTETPAPVEPAETWVYVDLAADMTGTTLTWMDNLGNVAASVPAPGEQYRVLGEWVYYQERTGGTVHRVNEAGQDERFDFMALPEGNFETVDWAIAPDGTQIVWNLFAYESAQSGGSAITTDLYIATIATGETRLLISHVLPEARILTPWGFSPDGSQVFVYLQLYGIGGLWSRYGAFSTLDVDTGQLTPLPDPAHDPAPEESFPGSAVALGDDGTRLVRFLYVQDQGFRVNLTDLASGQTAEVMALPSEIEYVQVGDVVLSPDGSTLIYTVIHGDWGSEGFVMFQVDLAAGTQRELLPLQPNRYRVVRFEDDGSLLLTADWPKEERGAWRLHPDGTLDHLSELTFVGVAE